MVTKDITAFIMGICIPHRLEWLRHSIEFLDKQKFPFKNKLLAIDEFGGYCLPKDLEEFFVKCGWTVLKGSYKSRSKMTDLVLKQVDTSIIFYNEDDVLATMPSYNDILTIFNTEINNRKCGMLSLALGGTNMNLPKGELGDLKFISENSILKNEEYIIFKRLESLRSDWFFEFPGLFIDSDLFKSCHNQAYQYKTGIEQSLTLAYFNLEYDKKMYKASVCKKDTESILNTSPLKMNDCCRLLVNLDVNQGNGVGSSQRY